MFLLPTLWLREDLGAIGLRDGVGACGGVAAVVGLKKPQAPPTPRFPASQLVETDVCVVTAGQALRQRSDAVSK